MIQRRQSLYLLIVFVLSIVLFTGPLGFIIDMEGKSIFLKHSGAFLGDQKLDISTWPMTIMISISVILSFFSIFSYKNRPRQMRLSLFLMFFNMGFIVLQVYYVNYIMKHFNGDQFGFQWRIVIPPVMLVLLILAFQAIRKDEILVKAYDRLR